MCFSSAIFVLIEVQCQCLLVSNRKIRIFQKKSFCFISTLLSMEIGNRNKKIHEKIHSFLQETTYLTSNFLITLPRNLLLTLQLLEPELLLHLGLLGGQPRVLLLLGRRRRQGVHRRQDDNRAAHPGGAPMARRMGQGRLKLVQDGGTLKVLRCF